MKRNNLVVTTLLTVSLLLMMTMQSCNSSDRGKTENKAAAVVAVPPTPVFVLQKGMLASRLDIPGELIAFQKVDLYAKVSSFVKKMYVDVGSQVKQGQLLATMEAPEIGSQLAGSQSKLESFNALYQASKATYNRLLETSKTPGTISPNELELALAKQNSDLAQLNAAKAAAREITDTRNYLEIRAPFSGVISARNVSAGAYVGPAGKGSDMPIFSLQQQSKLRLVASIPATYTSFLNNKSKVNFTVNSLAGEKFTATIARLSGALDNRLRSESIEMDVDNSSKKLLPGMIAEISIPLPAQDSSFVVPKTAVVNSTQKIFVIRKLNGKAEWVEIKKGRDADGKTEVYGGGLKTGDTLVTSGSEEIREGTVIK
ncbi:efflux RND transporter periplasmic adaptor subunit [Ferruginibacter paludis]|uniref:efflux RND transporter periplasmic adaptor subunit n=1 Tax=Ferruginibacter paludis TaxID=1310417 RepID=UPI0025B2BAB0|nr:efflux RND transporter periplasmic adaptor subunit [Ferruginibacter paludis]MDN3654567.1 efflux RND transporter periplasmic adaptor subunit [Ferruginibacter paludis]